MPDINLTCVIHGIKDMRLEETPIPQPKQGEIQVKVHSVGICGSDVHFWQRGRIGKYVLEKPLILGHEGTGVVTAIGPDTSTPLKVGDRVAVDPGVPCRMCDFCKQGRYNLCPEEKFCATPPDDGNLRRFYCHPADFCHKLPDNVSFEEGALVQPFSCGLHGCRRAGVTVGKKVLICGAGPIGLVVMLCAKAMGAHFIGITDVMQSRLDFAKELGAGCTLNVAKCGTDDPKEIAKKIQACMGGMPDISFECSGAEMSTKTAIYSTKSGGVVQCIGMGPLEIQIPLLNALCREVDIRGNFRYTNAYPTALAMVSSGLVDLKPLVTHQFPLEKCWDAFEVARTSAGIKVIIQCWKDD